MNGNPNPKHTPGPWSRNIKPARKYTVIFSGRSTHVARVVPDGLSDEEVEANCDLIAVAPEMLAALRAILFQVIQGPVLERDACITQAREAYAKAMK